jgi:hypothetical protein
MLSGKFFFSATCLRRLLDPEVQILDIQRPELRGRPVKYDCEGG